MRPRAWSALALCLLRTQRPLLPAAGRLLGKYSPSGGADTRERIIRPSAACPLRRRQCPAKISSGFCDSSSREGPDTLLGGGGRISPCNLGSGGGARPSPC